VGSGLRVPFPWEDRGLERATHDELGAVPTTDLEAAFPGAAEFSRRVGGDSDPNRSRRGAEGAARQVHADLVARGLDTPYEVVRDRVNHARAVSAAKKSR